jgi:hypothetical protein
MAYIRHFWLIEAISWKGDHVAELDVELPENDNGWSPYLPVEDANKLDTVRDALKAGDIKKHLNQLVFLVSFL